jgi:hypothetical protein
MAARIDIIDLLMHGGLSSGRRHGSGISVSDLLDALLTPKTAKEETDHISEAVDMLIKEGMMALLKPITTRSRVQINADTVYIGPEGFPSDHPHVNILTRHTKPEKHDRWRLWSFCPSRSTTHAFRFSGIPDIAQAEVVANIIMDIGLGKYPPGYLEEFVSTERRKKRASEAGPAPAAKS